MRTRPTNKFRLKVKMLMNPKMKSDEVILINSDQSPSEDHTDESKKKRKVISDDETNEKFQKIPVSKRKTKKKVKAKYSSGNRKLKRKLFVEDDELKSDKSEAFDDMISDRVPKELDQEKVQANDSEKPFETSSNLQEPKGKEIYIEDLAEEIKQIETEEKIEENEKSLKQKFKEWMMLLYQEKGKDKEGKAA